ncbi:MAG: serine/threonine protein kinase [Myxococcota bacterium]|nr:serine/threonine protein kinase [Myxococcota bacterium]
MRGPTLEHILARTPGVGMPLDRTRRIARQIVLALDDVHAHKVVHRDLKPSNVLLATEGGVEVAKVTDFGLVKLVDIGLGRTTALAGATLGYAPPEQFEQGNRRVSQRTDVFSFAALLYEMLTGAKAFPHGDRENPLVVVTRLLNGPRPSLLSTRGSLPRELVMRPDLVERLDALIVRATAAEPGERHGSMGEFWRAVDPWLRAAYEPASPPDGIAETAIDRATAVDMPTRPPFAHFNGPSAWSWRVRVPPVPGASARAAVFDPSGESAVAIGPAGLLTWEGSTWTHRPATANVDVHTIRGVAWLRPGELLVFGKGGLVARLVPDAPPDTWPLADREVTFLAAHVDAPGTTVTLVGERPAGRAERNAKQSVTTGVIAQFARGKLMLLAEVPACTRLRGVTRLRAGEIVGCGDWGALVRVELGVPNHVGSICDGHLYAIAALADGGAVAIGAGGHALSLSPRLKAQLEAVQTTRDLRALAMDGAGVAWAGSAHARLLRRTEGKWVRMSGELGLASSVVALWAAPSAVRAICDDGAIIEGIASDDHVDR